MQSSKTDNILTKINYTPRKSETEVSHLEDIGVLCIYILRKNERKKTVVNVLR